jgi:hypothetical protein
MGFTAVPDKSDGDVFTEAMWDTYIRDNFNTGVPVLLSDTVLAAAAASIDVTSIPDDWNHLLLITYLRSDTAASFTQTEMRFNNDSGSTSYDSQNISGSGSTASAAEELSQSFIPCTAMPAASAGSNLFGSHIITIPNYAQADNDKAAHILAALKYGTSTGNLFVQSRAVFWRSTAAINRITILPAAGNLVIGSRLTIYGMP